MIAPKKHRRVETRRPLGLRKFSPSVEAFERRELLATGILQGIVATPQGTPLPGAKVHLFQGTTEVTAPVTTIGDGKYQFTGLAPGDYSIVQEPPAGWVNVSAKAVATIDPAQVLNASTIQVTLLDPSEITTTWDYTQYVNLFNSGQYERIMPIIAGTGYNGNFVLPTGPLPFTFNRPAPYGSTPQYYSFCIDSNSDLPAYSTTFPTVPGTIPNLPGSAVNAGRIAYLLNHYGTNPDGTMLRVGIDPLPSRIQGAALQISILELLYDIDATWSSSDLTTGNFNIGSPATNDDHSASEFNALKTQVNAYLNDSVGKNEAALFLIADATKLTDRQSTIATETLNFINDTTNIQIVKLTNGTDNDTITGPLVPVGSTVTWTYNVTTTGNLPLSSVTVTDDQAGINPTPVLSGSFNVGDTNHDGLLQAGETWVYAATGIAIAGQYTNLGSVTGTPVDHSGTPIPDATKPTDTNPDHYFGSAPGIKLVKLTNGTDNDSAPGPIVPVGSTATFTYLVTNTGNVPLSAVTVTDDNGTPGNLADDFIATFVGGDSNSNGLLDLTETFRFTATRIVTAGQYGNLGTATGTPPPGGGTPVTDTNPDNHFGATPGIKLVKLTNGTDNNSVTGPIVPLGSTVTWTYIVKNTGNVPLGTVAVRDDNGTPGSMGDDFNATYSGGDANGNGLLDLTETWTFTASALAAAGQYVNYATVTGKDVTNTTVTDTDLDHYFGAKPGINLVKLTNGTDNNSATGPIVPVGSTVTWTYIVKNTGNVPLSNLVVRDDNGTPGNIADDFNATYSGGDANGNNKLDLTETWTFTASRNAAAGQYENYATVTSKDSTNTTVTDTDLDHYFGQSPKGTISGTKFNDLTGNGKSDDDTPLGGVKIYIDKNNNNTLDSGDISTTTAADGTYSFTGLAAGSYTVREVVPTGWIRTGPALTDEYVVIVTAGKDSGGNDFANADIGCECQISNIVYIINGSRQVTDLRGNVNPGDTVTAKFTVKNASSSNPATFSLVSYTAPDDTFVASQAYKQEVFDMVTMTYTSNGSYSLKVDVPDSYFQVDFVCGEVIDRFGPDGSNIFYTPQGRLFSADNGGCKPYNNALTADDTGTVAFWCSTSGQNLIKSLNGSSNSLNLGNWLSSNFSNLYGSLAGKTNAQVATYFQTLKAASSTALEAQVLATALSVYVTDVDLADMAAYTYGFNTSYLGIAQKLFNVGSNGSSIGLTNNAKQSLWVILKAANTNSLNGKLTVTYRSNATSLFTQLNTSGSLDG